MADQPLAQVSVIIAAYRAAETIRKAVASALLAQEVAEVIVVDDASGDDTADRAKGADDGSGRLKVLQLGVNGGPSAARNLALDQGHAPYIAVLDADDFLLPGRFARILAAGEYALVADNIVFVTPDRASGLRADNLPKASAAVRALEPADFVAGNLARPGLQRGELGFLKPVMSRAFLDRHGLRYDPQLRLGEDYDLYMRMMLAGARFGVTESIGYAAVVREGSLSGRHRTEDLKALAEASGRHLATAGLAPDLRKVIARHHSETYAKYLHRAFLDTKSQGGPVRALGFAVVPPTRLLPIARGILRDKLAARRASPPAPSSERYLLRTGSADPS